MLTSSPSEGQARMTLFASSGQARTFNYQVIFRENICKSTSNNFGSFCRLVMLVSTTSHFDLDAFFAKHQRQGYVPATYGRCCGK